MQKKGMIRGKSMWVAEYDTLELSDLQQTTWTQIPLDDQPTRVWSNYIYLKLE